MLGGWLAVPAPMRDLAYTVPSSAMRASPVGRTYLTLDADTELPIDQRATTRLATAFNRGDAWVESGSGIDFVVVNAKTGDPVPRPRVAKRDKEMVS